MIDWIDLSDDARVELAETTAELDQVLQAVPPVEQTGAAEARRARLDGDSWLGAVVHTDDASTRTVDTPGGPLDLRMVVPTAPDAVYLHVHGGGFVLGAADQQDTLLSATAKMANVAVVSVEYRLAPEHPFPAGADDCEAAARWLVEHAADEFGTDRLLIGGESAGAHLAALTLLRLRDSLGSVAPFRAANLVFGIYDLGRSPSLRRWDDANRLLARRSMEWFIDCFAPGLDDEDRRDPALSPLFADLAHLVPALFTVGTADPLLDDSLFMGTRWHAAGNPSEVAVFPGAPHGFIAQPTTAARMALERQFDFVTHHARA